MKGAVRQEVALEGQGAYIDVETILANVYSIVLLCSKSQHVQTFSTKLGRPAEEILWALPSVLVLRQLSGMGRDNSTCMDHTRVRKV